MTSLISIKLLHENTRGVPWLPFPIPTSTTLKAELKNPAVLDHLFNYIFDNNLKGAGVSKNLPTSLKDVVVFKKDVNFVLFYRFTCNFAQW